MSPVPERFSDAVGAMITNEKNELLVLFHKRLQMWSIPGGKVDPYEHPSDAVIRELMEETGLHADKVQMISTRPYQMRYPNDSYPSQLILFRCHVSNYTPLENKEPEKHICIQWMDMKSVHQLARTMLTDMAIEYYYKQERLNLIRYI